MSEAIHQDRAPSYAELRAIVDLAPDAIFIADTDGRYTFVNEAACRLLGYSASEILGKSIVDLIPAEDVPRLLASKAALGGDATTIGEWTLRRKDGTCVPVEVHAKVLGDGQWQGFARDVSARSAREAERDRLLAETESQRRWLQAVMDTLPLAVLLFEPDRRLKFNHRAEELLGMTLSPDGGSAQYANRIHLPDGTPVPASRLVSERVLERGETVIGEEYLIVRPDGTRVPVLGSAAPIRDAAGRTLGAIGVFQDVSERMRLDEAIRLNERLLQGIFELLPAGVWIADESGRIVRGNPAGRRIWKGARYVPVPEFDQYRGWWLDTGERIAAEQWALARALQHGETSVGELIRIQCFDGSFKTILNSAAPLRDTAGRITGAIVVNEDITALHEAQEKQRVSEQLLRTVFELLPVGVWVADRTGHIELSNPAGRRIWAGMRHVGPERFGEYRAWWVDSGKPIEPEEWGLARAIRYGETSRGELIRIQSFDGAFKTVINWAAPIRSDGDEIVGAIAVNQDVTSLQHTQEQLRATVRDREEILATVAHDLRNPLHGIMLNASMLEHVTSELPGGEPAREIAASVVETAQRMSGLVDDLLAVAVASTAGRSMVKVEPVAASELLGRAAKMAVPLLAAKDLRLALKEPDELPIVNADSDRILRVFGNLIDNARKFTAPHGIITVAAEETVGGVLFSVANSGDALPHDQIEAMFQPFWQAKRDRRGAGLGLSICRYIVEEHGGVIWAEPAEGQRVRVVFVLPRQSARLDPLQTRRNDREAASGETKVQS